jgi:hypothetical protein
MSKYTQDPKLRSIYELAHELGKLKFAKGTIGQKLNIAYVKVSQLKISADYQRYIQTATIKKAKQFNYTLCQVLFVAQRPDGDFVVVDGQHKALMAYLGGGNDVEVPCMIYEHGEDASLPDCIAVEAQLFSDLNTTRKNTSTLDKIRAGLSYADEDAIKFEEDFIAIGVKSEGIGYEDGPEVNGFAKAVESIKKWKIENTRKAVDHLLPIYENKWNKSGYVDGSMIGAFAAVFNLINALGKGEKANGLRNYIRTCVGGIGLDKWTENSRGNSDIIIARKIINKYNDAVRQAFVKGSTIGEDVLKNNRLGDPTVVS